MTVIPFAFDQRQMRATVYSGPVIRRLPKLRQEERTLGSGLRQHNHGTKPRDGAGSLSHVTVEATVAERLPERLNGE